jgi:hypothetical protein
VARTIRCCATHERRWRGWSVAAATCAPASPSTSSPSSGTAAGASLRHCPHRRHPLRSGGRPLAPEPGGGRRTPPRARRQRVRDRLRVGEQLGELGERLEAKRRLVPFGVEIMGRVPELRTLADIAAISSPVPRMRPVLAFAHLHAVTGGDFTIVEPFADVLATAEGVTPPGAPFHIHFSDISPANRNEKAPLPYRQGTPRAEPLAEAIANARRPATIIGESPDEASNQAIRAVLFGQPPPHPPTAAPRLSSPTTSAESTPEPLRTRRPDAPPARRARSRSRDERSGDSARTAGVSSSACCSSPRVSRSGSSPTATRHHLPSSGTGPKPYARRSREFAARHIGTEGGDDRAVLKPNRQWPGLTSTSEARCEAPASDCPVGDGGAHLVPRNAGLQPECGLQRVQDEDVVVRVVVFRWAGATVHRGCYRLLGEPQVKRTGVVAAGTAAAGRANGA